MDIESLPDLEKRILNKLLKERTLKIAKRMYIEGGYTKEEVMHFTEITEEDFNKEIANKV